MENVFSFLSASLTIFQLSETPFLLWLLHSFHPHYCSVTVRTRSAHQGLRHPHAEAVESNVDICILAQFYQIYKSKFPPRGECDYSGHGNRASRISVRCGAGVSHRWRPDCLSADICPPFGQKGGRDCCCCVILGPSNVRGYQQRRHRPVRAASTRGCEAEDQQCECITTLSTSINFFIINDIMVFL